MAIRPNPLVFGILETLSGQKNVVYKATAAANLLQMDVLCLWGQWSYFKNNAWLSKLRLATLSMLGMLQLSEISKYLHINA